MGIRLVAPVAHTPTSLPFDPSRAGTGIKRQRKGARLLARPQAGDGPATSVPTLSPEELVEAEEAIRTVTVPDTELSPTQQRARQESRRFEDVTDSEYWVAICFESRDQKEAFLRALNLLDEGDKYLSGPELARRIGLNLKSDASARRNVQINHRWDKHVTTKKGKGR